MTSTRAATVKLAPSPIPPTPAMTTVPVFLRHNETVLAQRSGEPPGRLVAGHKKDVVIANKVFATTGKVAIYGWHRAVGKPIQPLYTGHTAAWVDYSHGVRLVRRRMTGRRPGEDGRRGPRRPGTRGAPEPRRRDAQDPLRADPADASRPARRAAIEVLRLDPGVRVVIDRPEAASAKPVLLVFYALPNGNTIEQTIGKAIEPGDDWHFDIQHIGAQTRFLREAIDDREVVVAYLENDLKSWPAWRRTHGDGAIPAILEAVSDRFDGAADPDRPRRPQRGREPDLRLSQRRRGDPRPGRADRVPRRQLRLRDRPPPRQAGGLAEGVRPALPLRPRLQRRRGAPGRQDLRQRRRGDLGPEPPHASRPGGVVPVHRTTSPPTRSDRPRLEGRVEFLLKENPERKVLHTVQVEKNGFIESMLSGTKRQGVGYTYFGDRAYSRFIRR